MSLLTPRNKKDPCITMISLNSRLDVSACSACHHVHCSLMKDADIKLLFTIIVTNGPLLLILLLKNHVFVCLMTMKISQWAHKKNFCSYCKIDILTVFDSLKIKQLLDYSFSSFELILCKRSWILSPIRNRSCITWLEGFCLETRLSKDWRLVFKPSIAFI